MGKPYNPLADFITRMMDNYIKTYLQECATPSFEDFKDILNYYYLHGEMSARMCTIMAQRYQVITNQAS